MNTIANGGGSIPAVYKTKRQKQVQLDQLIEMRDFRIVGQEGGMLLVEVDLDINKESYTFIGPIQVVKEPEVAKISGPTFVKFQD